MRRWKTNLSWKLSGNCCIFRRSLGAVVLTCGVAKLSETAVATFLRYNCRYLPWQEYKMEHSREPKLITGSKFAKRRIFIRFTHATQRDNFHFTDYLSKGERQPMAKQSGATHMGTGKRCRYQCSAQLWASWQTDSIGCIEPPRFRRIAKVPTFW